MENFPVRYSRGDQMVSESSPLDYIYKFSRQDKPEAKFLDDLFGGSSSGYGHVKSCGIDLAILTTALAALGAMAFVLYSKITMNKGRKRKRSKANSNTCSNLYLLFRNSIHTIVCTFTKHTDNATHMI